ncbi:hypothetical protein PROFUN_03313 [Planoprotostelium fungivorum]|uniref:Uncharacterized protein n=1 Tax=Planoprotostelium fungivorum TaxID=1890364 RepID=A0A2P6NWR5_9EUKA|nr:hypothetical protein PROFUN_03313 [Planoprotostelium fungivorum]
MNDPVVRPDVNNPALEIWRSCVSRINEGHKPDNGQPETDKPSMSEGSYATTVYTAGRKISEQE